MFVNFVSFVYLIFTENECDDVTDGDEAPRTEYGLTEAVTLTPLFSPEADIHRV